jgi:hypothetical protein
MNGPGNGTTTSSRKATWRTIGISLVIGFLMGLAVTNIFNSQGRVVMPMAVDDPNDLPTILYTTTTQQQEEEEKEEEEETTITTLTIPPAITMAPAATAAAAAAAVATEAVAVATETESSPSSVGMVTPEITNNNNNSSNNHSNSDSNSKIVVEFERQDRVVIVTKLHSRVHFSLLEQSLCLLHYAYNVRLNYDIVVFYTEDIPYDYVERIKAIVAPAKISVVMDNKGLREEVNDLNPERKAALLQRCNVTTVDEMDWFTNCMEEKAGGLQRLAYTWQAEFRALHIWHHPALREYKYMMWLDTDGFCTRVWPRDPIAYFIQQNLVMMFDHFPQGSSRGEEFQQRIGAAFNTTLCGITLTKKGKLVATTTTSTSTGGGRCDRSRIPQIHGFFHITDLDFYRSDPVMKWNRILIGNEKFSRRFDDQIAVTVPVAILAPNQSQEMERAGLKLDVFHNFKLDGKYQVGGFKSYWSKYGASNFSEAYGNCAVTDAGRRR